MKTTRQIIFLFLAVAGLFVACEKDSNNEIDQDPPQIHIDFAGAFPVQCSEIERGQKFTFKARLSDNVALGNVSVDIHHNFDHHSHSTEIDECDLAPKKSPIKPLVFIKSYTIAQGLKEYETNVEIDVPADIDPGDYHFMIIVTDQEGWSDTKGLSIKIK
ncbi:DUF4625 domain-containing protein [Parapedobacter sp. SGR-10]|uniref:DUF4625 domain-containing protein n=1 Tax=Parapedobacter sp. SGR-10 TaxID=2710879 RepID=UPI0013D1A387|nr:DUF4625 domain-containing protein [Parapedobacter sp. SGR-10]NGF57965.1 DUF4625 domain-containing protein [Parapedobacter sp. SGR-10]